MNRPNKKTPSSSSFASLLASIFELILCKLILYVRRMSKFLIHLVTGKSELERICANETSLATRIQKIEKSLSKSSNHQLKEVTKRLSSCGGAEDEIVLTIMKVKNIPHESISFQMRMKEAILKMAAYQNLIAQVEQTRVQTFSGDNREHDTMLMSIWHGLKGADDRLGDDEKTRITKRWSEIGFQGTNPATDFRSMGMLAPEGLQYLVTEYNKIALSLYSKSLHPRHGYPFAIAAINVIAWTHRFLLDGHLKAHFYTQPLDAANTHTFYKIFICLFIDFNDFWFAKEPSIMQFEQISKEFVASAKNWVKVQANLEIKQSQLNRFI